MIVVNGILMEKGELCEILCLTTKSHGWYVKRHSLLKQPEGKRTLVINTVSDWVCWIKRKYISHYLMRYWQTDR